MNRKPSLLIVFLTVFMDLIGFGIVVPLTPLFSRDFGANAWMLGAILSAYSAMQFFFSPVWGKLSDRHGRRPIMLISLAGSAISYVIFALASGLPNHSAALWLLLGARAFGGACGGNITVAQAYIADITPPENRSKRMGLIGMAFGLGFIFGPAISGLMLKYFGITAPGWAAAGICALNFILALAMLPESRKPDSSPVANRPRLAQWQHTLAQPKIGVLILVFFLATFAFSCFEVTLAWLVNDNFHLNYSRENAGSATTIVSLFVFCGLIGATIQGGMIGRFVKIFGEPKLIAISLVLTGISLLLLPFMKGQGQLHWLAVLKLADIPWLKMLGALALLAFASSLTRAPLFGLLSNLTSANEQGATLGVAQSAGSLARIFGPIFASSLYLTHAPLPYLICGGIAILAGLLAARRLTAK
ncbi:MAG TPA: MFS transporter [Candidatus Sulfotelmatobacter sp.]|nr:MFS transporter [Candidatus Sulfotelmatobacter sp.]